MTTGKMASTTDQPPPAKVPSSSPGEASDAPGDTGAPRMQTFGEGFGPAPESEAK
jgi:hypothetical protein